MLPAFLFGGFVWNSHGGDIVFGSGKSRCFGFNNGYCLVVDSTFSVYEYGSYSTWDEWNKAIGLFYDHSI